MKLIAKWYVKISGRNYTPGEMIDIPAMNGNIQRLLDMGAVKAAPSYSAAAEPSDPKALADDKGFNEASGNDEDMADSKASDTVEDEESGAETSDPNDEEEDGAEAPVIDVADGLVTDEESHSQPKPKAAKGRKKA